MCVLILRRSGSRIQCVVISLWQRVHLQDIHPMNLGGALLFKFFLISSDQMWSQILPPSSVYLISDYNSVPPICKVYFAELFFFFRCLIDYVV
ncbi:hypothetical protein GDO78_016517 [Eleutherodactylus coqui]|uniref:Uncharacterized protein n=1 Tax=Eleutherodactylus coqui TaxID=57060 RepID=A0A8J6JZ26_ELECQ|nr:hypothetical protein GDO78_016517 [Eleutherodactylus coqui]